MQQINHPDVEERVNLIEPVPVFLTYLTVASTSEGVVFRPDPYGRGRRTAVAVTPKVLAPKARIPKQTGEPSLNEPVGSRCAFLQVTTPHLRRVPISKGQ